MFEFRIILHFHQPHTHLNHPIIGMFRFGLLLTHFEIKMLQNFTSYQYANQNHPAQLPHQKYYNSEQYALQSQVKIRISIENNYVAFHIF